MKPPNNSLGYVEVDANLNVPQPGDNWEQWLSLKGNNRGAEVLVRIAHLAQFSGNQGDNFLPLKLIFFLLSMRGINRGAQGLCALHELSTVRSSATRSRQWGCGVAGSSKSKEHVHAQSDRSKEHVHAQSDRSEAHVHAQRIRSNPLISRGNGCCAGGYGCFQVCKSRGANTKYQFKFKPRYLKIGKTGAVKQQPAEFQDASEMRMSFKGSFYPHKHTFAGPCPVPSEACPSVAATGHTPVGTNIIFTDPNSRAFHMQGSLPNPLEARPSASATMNILHQSRPVTSTHVTEPPRAEKILVDSFSDQVILSLKQMLHCPPNYVLSPARSLRGSCQSRK
eukprot:scaffold79300_cov19-Tisochrysis_lutea.AAC.2